jgi:hypothetical protein
MDPRWKEAFEKACYGRHGSRPDCPACPGARWCRRRTREMDAVWRRNEKEVSVHGNPA